MKKVITFCAFALAMGGGFASAGDFFGSQSGKGIVLVQPPLEQACFSYDYLDFHYLNLDLGSSWLIGGQGFSVGISKSIGERFFLTGSYQESVYDYDWINHIVEVDQKRYRFGAGFRHTVARCFDLTFEGGAQHLDASYEQKYWDHDYDSWGYYVGPGFRAMVGKFEFFAHAFYGKHEGDMREEYLSHHTPIYDRVDDYFWRFTPGVIYHVTENVGLKVAAEYERHDTEWLFGLRVAY